MNYKNLIEEYVLKTISNSLKSPYGTMKKPFIDPGAGYNGSLWDWDSYWMALALMKSFDVIDEKRLNDAGITKEKVALHAKGSVENFLLNQSDDGYIPLTIQGEGLFSYCFTAEHEKGKEINQMKPFLCGATLNVSEFINDFDWFDENQLIKYIEFYENNQKDDRTGLFFWQDDIMIGIDNNPTVYFRPNKSSADIYLNSFIYAEYIALAEILKKKSRKEYTTYENKASELKNAINTYMWDERDGLYYSQDIGFNYQTRKIATFEFHKNLLPKWKCIPLKIRFWGCFLPMLVGICDDKRAKRIVNHILDENVLSPYGLRTLSKDEPMYSSEKSSNPSNWLGAIWNVATYCTVEGLKKYGYEEIAKSICDRTVKLYGTNLEKYGDFFESYDPDTGEPNMHPGFMSWNLLILQMME